jgi:hypothetical protein
MELESMWKNAGVVYCMVIGYTSTEKDQGPNTLLVKFSRVLKSGPTEIKVRYAVS